MLLTSAAIFSNILIVSGGTDAACLVNASVSEACHDHIDPHGEVVALLQTSHEVIGQRPSGNRGSVWPQRAGNTAKAMLGLGPGLDGRSGAASTQILLVILAIAIPVSCIICVMSCDAYVRTLRQPLPPKTKDSSNEIERTSLLSGSLPPRTPPRVPPSTPHRSGFQSMTPTSSSAAPSILPFPAIAPHAIMQNMEAHFMVLLDQLTKIRKEEVQVRGSSTKALLVVRYSEVSNGLASSYRKLEFMPVSPRDSPALSCIISRPSAQCLEVMGQSEELYGIVSMESATRAILKYRNEPAMAFTLGNQAGMEMRASLLTNGRAMGEARIEEADGKRLWVVQVSPGGDWVCIMAVFLGLIAMPLTG